MCLNFFYRFLSLELDFDSNSMHEKSTRHSLTHTAAAKSISYFMVHVRLHECLSDFIAASIVYSNSQYHY